MKHKMTSSPNVSMMDALKADVWNHLIVMINDSGTVLRAGASSSMAEHRTFNPLVQGSSPWGPTEGRESIYGFPSFILFSGLEPVRAGPVGESPGGAFDLDRAREAGTKRRLGHHHRVATRQERTPLMIYDSTPVSVRSLKQRIRNLEGTEGLAVS